jgi:hypothetical protein
MCEASIHVPHRAAKKEERLQVETLPGGYNLRGLYPQDKTGDTRLVCIKGQVEGWVEKIEFSNKFMTPPTALKKAWEGKTNVPVVITRGGYHDVLAMADGSVIYTMMLAEGTKVNVGVPIPVTGEPGMTVVEQALVEVDKTEATNVVAKKAGTIRKRKVVTKA